MKGQLEELGEETDDNVENISKMQGQILNMTKGKVNIFDDLGNFKSTYEIMKGIAEVWDDLSSIDQADLLETIAGKHRANDVAALLSNWENVEAAVKSASEAEGSAAEENAKYIDSIQGRLDVLKTAWQSFANTFMNSDFLKGAVSGLTTFVELIEKLAENIGTIGTIGLGTGIYEMFKHRSGLSFLFKELSGFGSLASDIWKSGGKITDRFKDIGRAAGVAGGDIAGKLSGSITATVGAIGLAVAAIGLIVTAIKKAKEEESRLRQETIQTSNEFLDAAGSFEQAYIKYSGRTDLTAEEESELETAIKGTVDALGNKSSALQDVVNSSNDYLASLEAITKAELKVAASTAEEKRVAAEKELKSIVEPNIVQFLDGDSSSVNVIVERRNAGSAEPDNASEAEKIAREAAGKYYQLLDANRGSTYYGFELPSNASVEEIVDYYYSLVDAKNRLLENDFGETDIFDSIDKTIDKMSESIAAYENGVYDAAKAQYQLIHGIPKTTEAYLKMRESVLNEIGGTVDTRKSIASSLDSEYGQMFDLTTNDVQARKLIGVLEEYGDAEAGRIETFLNMRTAVNNNECTVGDYMSQFDDINKMTEGWSDEAKGELNTSFGLDTDTIKHQYDEAVKSYMRSFDDESGNLSGIQENFEKNFLDGLSASELAAVVNLKTEIDWQNDSWDNIRKQIEEEAALIEAISFSVNIELEAEKLENLSTAISESVSGAGLSTESMSLVEDMFGDLDGYDKSALFERTANGIRLNSDELRKLNDEYKKTNVDGLDNKIDALGEKYIQTREELSNLTYGTDEYNKKARELSDIEAQINATEKLAAQYSGLASAYQEWQRVESSGSQRDMYESMIEGFENIDDEISRGWLDDGTIEFLRLIKGENISATATTKELMKAYESLDDTIQNTTYSVRDFFTVDEDGNSTNTGVYNFLDAVGQLEEEKFGGKDVVKRDKDGNIIAFDFQVAGGDKAIADALGISEELVQIMVRAADDAGFVVSMDGTYQQLDVLKEKAQEAANKLKDTFKKTKHEFDLNTGNEGTVLKDYNEALKIWEEFKKNKNEDGTVDMSVKGAEEAYTLVSTLQSMVDRLGEPVYMELNTTQVEKDMQTPLSKLQEYERLVQQENQLKLKGTDTTEIDNAQKEIIDYFENLSPEIKAQLGIDNLSREEIQKKVEAGEIEIPATIDLQVEMNNTMRDMVNVALYNAGIIDKEELEARVDVSLYAGKIDTSDVDDKAEDAVENESAKAEKEVEVDIVAKYANNRELSEMIKDYTPSQQKVIVEYFAEHDEVDKYTPEQKEALVKFIAESKNIDSYKPEEKRAIVEYLTDSGDPDSWTPEQKEAVAKFIRESGDVDSYTPKQKEAIAKFIRDSIDPDTYSPDNKDATVTYNRDSSEVDNYNPKNFVRTVTYKIKEIVSKIASGGKKKVGQRTGADPAGDGVGNVNGTANVNGTIGMAFKQGSWGTKNSGTALVGELGRETLVRDGRYYTIGDTGAEFIKYHKGDIIFNHKQTEELFRNGKVTSDSGRAKALVGGTAFSRGVGGIGKVVLSKEKAVTNDKERVTSKTTTKKSGNSTTVNTQTIVGSGSTGSGSGSGKVEGNAAGSTDKSDKFEDTIDWIETILDRAERAIDKYEKQADNVYKTWDKRNKALENEIAEVESTISLYEQAKNKYLSEANEVGLTETNKYGVRYTKLIQEGSLSIEDFEGESDEKLVEKIKNYQDLYNKYLDCIDKIDELKEKEASLYSQRFDHVSEEYDNLLQGFEHTEAMLNEYISQAEAKGHIVSKEYYNALISNEEDRINTLKQEQADLIAARDEAVANNEFDKYSEDWYLIMPTYLAISM